MGEAFEPTSPKGSYVKGFVAACLFSVVFFLAALFLGLALGKRIATLSLIGTSIVLEAQPAAAASIPLGFHPFYGGVISILANLISIPIMMYAFHQIVHRFAFIRRRMQKAKKWSDKYGKYGVWILTPLSPVLGAYVCLAIGYMMHWRPVFVLSSILVGMITSTFLISYGGHAIVALFR